MYIYYYLYRSVDRWIDYDWLMFLLFENHLVMGIAIVLSRPWSDDWPLGGSTSMGFGRVTSGGAVVGNNTNKNNDVTMRTTATTTTTTTTTRTRRRRRRVLFPELLPITIVVVKLQWFSLVVDFSCRKECNLTIIWLLLFRQMVLILWYHVFLRLCSSLEHLFDPSKWYVQTEGRWCCHRNRPKGHLAGRWMQV